MNLATETAAESVGGIDFTPLIDVVFQLVLFLLITATFTNDERDLSITVPEAESGTPSKDLPETLVVGVRKDGTFTVGPEVLGKEDLRQVLVRAKRKNAKQTVILRAHKDAPTQFPVTVLGICTGLAIETKIATTDGAGG